MRRNDWERRQEPCLPLGVKSPLWLCLLSKIAVRATEALPSNLPRCLFTEDDLIPPLNKMNETSV